VESTPTTAPFTTRFLVPLVDASGLTAIINKFYVMGIIKPDGMFRGRAHGFTARAATS
jgi:hypothetical protein